MKKILIGVMILTVSGLALTWLIQPDDTDFVSGLLQQSQRAYRAVLGGDTPRVAGTGPEKTNPQEALTTGSGIRNSHPGKSWREPLTGMEFAWVPGGCFRMGSDPREQGRDTDEGPIHKVCVTGFWMGRFEVMRSQFRIFVERTSYVTDAEKEGYAWIYTGKWEKKPGYSWRRTGFSQDQTHPVVNVSWNDAKAMARWLSDEDGRDFQLPTEAQWEYACRAGTLSARHWGDDPAQACAYANVGDLSAKREFSAWTTHPCDDGFVFTAPGGHYQSNGFGLYDMLGNVWEWCEDVYLPEAYRMHKASHPVIEKGGKARVVRGGSWYSQPKFVRSASRDQLSLPSRRSHDQGFRLVIMP